MTRSPQEQISIITARAAVRLMDATSEADPVLAQMLSTKTAAWMPMVTDGEPTKLLVTAWLAHEGINNNRLAFRAQDLAPAAAKIAVPNILPMDWNHSAVVPQAEVPKAIGAWYAAEAKWNPEAKNGEGALGIEARGVVWAWAFREQATAMLAMQQANGYVEFSMACVHADAEYGSDADGHYTIAIEPVFFTLSALDVPPADVDAKGLVGLHESADEPEMALQAAAAEAPHDDDDAPDGQYDPEDEAMERATVWTMAKEKATNFPGPGDDKAVSLRNSQWPLFPVNEAQDLKDNWPEIWRRGGNIRGNSQFAKLAPVARRGGKATTAAEEYAVRLREAWVARHKGDFQLAGVVAQVKWLAVGSRGIDHMRSVLTEAKERVKARRASKIKEEAMDGNENEMSKAALEAALEANAVLKAELEKSTEAHTAAVAELTAQLEALTARAEQAELKGEALSAELAAAVETAVAMKAELETAQAKLAEIAAEQAAIETANRWTARFAELPEAYRAALAKRSEEEQARFVERWSAASDEAWSEYKSDMLVGFADIKVSYLSLSASEGKLPTGGDVPSLGERVSSLIK